jgi:hypothetical protein
MALKPCSQSCGFGRRNGCVAGWLSIDITMTYSNSTKIISKTGAAALGSVLSCASGCVILLLAYVSWQIGTKALAAIHGHGWNQGTIHTIGRLAISFVVLISLEVAMYYAFVVGILMFRIRGCIVRIQDGVCLILRDADVLYRLAPGNWKIRDRFGSLALRIGRHRGTLVVPYFLIDDFVE